MLKWISYYFLINFFDIGENKIDSTIYNKNINRSIKANQLMKTVFDGGKIVTGDGNTIIEKGYVVTHDGLITEVGKGSYSKTHKSGRIIEASDKLIIPGIINHHEHYLTFGPGIVGEYPWYEEKVIENLNKHMLQGTTTILNQDGLITPEEFAKTNYLHPINLKTTTLHIKPYIEAAEIISECPGLSEEHRKLTVGEMVNNGAVAIGEVEELTTLSTFYFPKIIKKRTGYYITSKDARRLLRAILGNVDNPPDFDPQKVNSILEDIDLAEKLDPVEIKNLFEETILKQHKICKKVYSEAGRLGAKYNIPVVVHYSLECMNWVVELAEKFAKKVNIIAAHCDSVTFSDVEAAIETTKKLKKMGVIANTTSYMKNHNEITDISARLFEENLVDNICTDGIMEHDSILFFIERLMEENLVGLSEAIAMVTSNVVDAIPNLAPHRGLIKEGKIADLVLVDEQEISNVEKVMIGGEIVVENGARPREEVPLMEPSVYDPEGRNPVRSLYTKLPSKLTRENSWLV